MANYGELLFLPGEMCSTTIDELSIRNHPWSLPNNQGVRYVEVINYSRRYCLDQDAHNCVMCGKHNVLIPSQNKDVCKTCDSSCWYNAKLNVVFKFCKGCKNFFSLEEFRDKPEASKCGKCRKRGRENYINKKMESSYLVYNVDPMSRKNSLDGMNEEYLSSNCPSVVSIVEEECVGASPPSNGVCIYSTEDIPMKKETPYKRPPKVPRRHSPGSEPRSTMNEFETPNHHSSSSRSRENSITQLLACSEQLDDDESDVDTKRRKLMIYSSSNDNVGNSNVVTPCAPHSTYRSHLVTDSPISSLNLIASTPPELTISQIRSSSPSRSILKGYNKENILVVTETPSSSSSNVVVVSDCEKVRVSSVDMASIVARNRQVSFSGENVNSPPNTLTPLRWDPSVDPLFNLAMLVSSASAEKV